MTQQQLVSPAAVLLAPKLLEGFLSESIKEYEDCTPELPPRCWAVLVGRHLGDAMRVERICFAGNIRETDEGVLDQFATLIVPCFGAAYANGRRGYWCDARELHRISREADAAGMEVLGSIHLHPDWHQIGPPHERGLDISEAPTAMDQFIFRNTGWPLNMILYLEQREGRLYHSLGAWSPPPSGDAERGCGAIAVRHGAPIAVGARRLDARRIVNHSEIFEPEGAGRR